MVTYFHTYCAHFHYTLHKKSLFPGPLPLPATVQPANKPKPPQPMKAEKKGSSESYHIMGPSCYIMTPTGYKYKGKGPSTHLPTSNKYVV